MCIHNNEPIKQDRQEGRIKLDYEVSWLKKNLVETKSRKERMGMIEKGDKKLSMTRQAELLDINRTSLYYRPVPISQEELDIKRLIDKIYTKHPE